jgi:hypothetical protein
VSTLETVIFLISSAGTLGMSIGAFGLLSAFNRDSQGSRTAVPLIGVYSLGVLLNVGALTAADAWYLAAPLALMLIPADVALRRHGFGRRAAADLSDFK